MSDCALCINGRIFFSELEGGCPACGRISGMTAGELHRFRVEQARAEERRKARPEERGPFRKWKPPFLKGSE